jgi:hypothetical protein
MHICDSPMCHEHSELFPSVPILMNRTTYPCSPLPADNRQQFLMPFGSRALFTVVFDERAQALQSQIPLHGDLI